MCSCNNPKNHLILLLTKKSKYLKIPKKNLLQTTKYLTNKKKTTTPKNKNNLSINAKNLKLLFANHKNNQK